MERAFLGAMPAGPLAERLLLRWLPWLLAVALHLGLIALWPASGRLAPNPQPAPAGPAMQVVQLWPAEPAGPARQEAPAAPPSARGVPRQAGAAVAARARSVAIPLPARTASRDASRTLNRAAGEGADPITPRGAGTGAAAEQRMPPGAMPARGKAATATAAATAPAGAQDGAGAASLLDTPATRQALRAVATGLSARALSDAAVGTVKPLSAEERLGREVARAGRGDCLRGEFFGGGAGLLSLPFWVAAQAQGKCRQ